MLSRYIDRRATTMAATEIPAIAASRKSRAGDFGTGVVVRTPDLVILSLHALIGAVAP